MMTNSGWIRTAVNSSWLNAWTKTCGNKNIAAKKCGMKL